MSTINNAKKRFRQGIITYQKLKETVKKHFKLPAQENLPEEEHIHSENCNHTHE